MGLIIVEFGSRLTIFMHAAIYQIGVPFRYGIQDIEGSAKRIYEAALGTPEDHLVILLAHNGPTGVWTCQFNHYLRPIGFSYKNIRRYFLQVLAVN